MLKKVSLKFSAQILIFSTSVEATKIRITVVDSGKAASFVDLTHINAFRRGVIVIGNK